MFLYTTFSMQLLSDFTFTHSICHAPRMMGTEQVSAGAAVITPQRRFTRAPQGSPKSLAGREEVSLSPRAVIAPDVPPSGSQGR